MGRQGTNVVEGARAPCLVDEGDALVVEEVGVGEELEVVHGVGCSPIRTWYRDGEGVEREEEKATEGRGVVSARRSGACGGGRSFGFERGEATEDGRDG